MPLVYTVLKTSGTACICCVMRKSMCFNVFYQELSPTRMIWIWWWFLHASADTWLIWHSTGYIIIKMPFYWLCLGHGTCSRRLNGQAMSSRCCGNRDSVYASTRWKVPLLDGFWGQIVWLSQRSVSDRHVVRAACDSLFFASRAGVCPGC